MTRELCLIGGTLFYCLYFVLFVHMPKECQDESFLGNGKKKLTHSFYLKEILKVAVFFYCFASRL